ncbi:Hsp20/alpha crystallin family protein [Halalkalicoccus sp. NIPERK01]|uniref:Hsp20/alpha crystallin family protein n=1 Tax=Halalkalicoccus sp. NIPERK01 TaxID=3053469 RepID=UPI00256F1588|nr:Hsp20/alpha crystallin family protein [Halalkalicoccus sp. NIPERK01]MDL5362496.1 Hsp20/alpha crystallin family protein [Halalkalicoccus sp. NIPERK01]
MSDEGTDEGDEAESKKSATDERTGGALRGFRLEAGLRPLTDLLGSLIEVNVSDAPVRSQEPNDESEPIHRSTADEPRSNRTKRVRSTGSENGECFVDTRWIDDEYLVTADVPGASKDDLSVGIDPRTNELVIGRDGSALERVDLPWASAEATTVRFNNGVLAVRLRPTE